MPIEPKRSMTFPLRLAISLKDIANLMAQEDGVSLNRFINLAVAEKVSRLESKTSKQHNTLISRKNFAIAR